MPHIIRDEATFRSNLSAFVESLVVHDTRTQYIMSRRLIDSLLDEIALTELEETFVSLAATLSSLQFPDDVVTHEFLVYQTMKEVARYQSGNLVYVCELEETCGEDVVEYQEVYIAEE